MIATYIAIGVLFIFVTSYIFRVTAAELRRSFWLVLFNIVIWPVGAVALIRLFRQTNDLAGEQTVQIASLHKILGAYFDKWPTHRVESPSGPELEHEYDFKTGPGFGKS